MSTGQKSFIGILALIVALVGALIFINKKSQEEQRKPQDVSDEVLSVLAVKNDDYTQGTSDATVTLVEYLDFECPACAAYHPLVKEVVDTYSDRILYVSRYFPLPGHPNGLTSAQAVEAAGKQGKYWEMYNLLFERQREWSQKATDITLFDTYAEELGLDMDQYRSDRDSEETKARITRDVQEGTAIGVNSTPSFYLGGQKIQGPGSVEEFSTLIDAALINAKLEQETSAEVHEHADFAVYLEGKKVDFSAAAYQSGSDGGDDHTDDDHLHEYLHLHDNIGYMLHKHKADETLGSFFESLGMQFTNECFVLDSGAQYCSDDANSLKFIVNGVPNDQFGSYSISDGDQFLISYGPKDADVSNELSSLTDEACIFSETCPERGTPPAESCVGGLGTTCD